MSSGWSRKFFGAASTLTTIAAPIGHGLPSAGATVNVAPFGLAILTAMGAPAAVTLICAAVVQAGASMLVPQPGVSRKFVNTTMAEIGSVIDIGSGGIRLAVNGAIV